MTTEERAAAMRVIAKGPYKKGSSLEAAAQEISRMRGAKEALSPMARKARSVSAAWVGKNLFGHRISSARSTAKSGQSESLDKVQTAKEMAEAWLKSYTRAIQDPDWHQEGEQRPASTQSGPAGRSEAARVERPDSGQVVERVPRGGLRQ